MKIPIRNLVVALIFMVSLARAANAAVTFSSTPNAVSNTYSGNITLKINGLTNSETVVAQLFLDLNTNHLIDAGDVLMRQCSLKDGQPGMVIGGVTNFNVSGDTDGAANGQITTSLNFFNPFGSVVGNYLLKLSSPVGHFPPMTNNFAVTNFPFAQKISGTVFSNGTSATVPNAVVELCPYAGVPTGEPLTGVVANNAGGYTIFAPPGTYSIYAVKSNYVANLTTAPVVNLLNGQNVTGNLTLTHATTSISGKVVDATNFSLKLPGISVVARSTNWLLAVAYTDTNGNFNLRVTAGTWAVNLSDLALSFHGYVGFEHGTNLSGGATGVTLPIPKASALVYGSVKDNEGNPVPALDVQASAESPYYQTDTYTDAQGNYVLGVLGLGTSNPWSVAANMEPNGDSQLTNYVFSAQTISGNINAGQAVLQNFTATDVNSFYVTTAELLAGYVGDVYRQQLAVANGQPPYVWTNISGSLPLGLFLSPSGLISGTPTTNGTCNFEIQVTDAANNTTTQPLAIIVGYPYLFATNNGAITITAYIGSGGAVIIPDKINGLPVTEIGTNAFRNQWSVTSVIIPSGVTNIEESAFQDCNFLSSVSIPNSVTTIGNFAFEGCSYSLASVIIPNSVVSIGDAAFAGSTLGSCLTGIYFAGNAPTAGVLAFCDNDYATVYYNSCASGWGATLGDAPTAKLNFIVFTANPEGGVVPLTVDFAAPALESCGRTITNWTWNFGDGSTTNARNPTHIYAAAANPYLGYFQPTLVATDTAGVAIHGVGPSISVAPLTIAYTADTTIGLAPVTVSFTSDRVDDVGNAISGWNWDFGDGLSSTLQNPRHTYSSLGTFAPSLMATNNLGYVILGVGPAAITVTNAPVHCGLVLNGGFETGDFTGWTLSGDTNYIVVDEGYYTTAQSGAYVATLLAADEVNISQTLATTAGRFYVLSFWLSSDNWYSSGEFRVTWNGSTIFETTNANAYVGTWSNLQFVVSATQTNTVLEFAVEVFDDSDPVFDLDAISAITITNGVQVVSGVLPNAMKGVAYSQQLSAIYGQMPYNWLSLSSGIPPGLLLSTNGVLSGTPTDVGTFDFTVVVTDLTMNTATQTLTLAIGYPPSIEWQPSNVSPVAGFGSNVSLAVSVSGNGPFSYQWQFDGTNLPDWMLTTLAGFVNSGYSGDGGRAIYAELDMPCNVAADSSGNLFIADTRNNVVRKVSPGGIITTVAGDGFWAGTGEGTLSGDGGPATSATMYYPRGMAVDARGNLFIADSGDCVIRKVNSSGIIATVVGKGWGYDGDGGAATNAELFDPEGLAFDSTGDLFIADSYNNVIREVKTNGLIMTVAGNGYGAGTGVGGYSGDGRMACDAELNFPCGIAVDGSGNLFIADSGNNVIREVRTNGIIITVAGNGTNGYRGDMGAATNAELNDPSGVAIDITGNLFIADSYNNVVREVGTNGVITTVAGNGQYGCNGSEGVATNVELNQPFGVAVDGAGSLLIADTFNNCIRNVVIPGPMLALEDVDFSNSGAYDVVVSSPYGSITSSVVNVTVTFPVILAAPQLDLHKTNITFELVGPAGRNYVLQVSTNLVNWNSVSTSTIPANGAINLTNAVSGYNRRFFRAVLP